MQPFENVRKVRKALGFLIIAEIIATIGYAILTGYYIINCFSTIYLLFALIVTFCLYRFLSSIIKNEKTKNSVGVAAFIYTFIIVILSLMLVLVNSMREHRYNKEKYYPITVTGLSEDHNLYVLEIDLFNEAKLGFLLDKVNSNVYKKISTSHYYVKSPYSPLETNNYFVEYYEEENKLIFYYMENEKLTSFKKITCFL